MSGEIAENKFGNIFEANKGNLSEVVPKIAAKMRGLSPKQFVEIRIPKIKLEEAQGLRSTIIQQLKSKPNNFRIGTTGSEGYDFIAIELTLEALKGSYYEFLITRQISPRASTSKKRR